MIVTRRREGVISRASFEDGSSQSRLCNSQSRYTFRNRTQKTLESYNLGSNVISTVSSRKQPKYPQRKNVIDGTSSSESEEDEEFILKHRILRYIDDCGNGESSNRRVTRSVLRNEQETEAFLKIPTQRYFVSDSSSDDSEISPRTVKKRKRPLSPINSNDSSDNSVPIDYKRSSKRLKRFSSSESTSSESSSDISDHNLEHDVSNAVEGKNTNTGRVNFNGFYRTRSSVHYHENVENGSDVQGPIVRSFRRRRAPVMESESESDLVSTSHTVRGRRMPVISSEDDEDLPAENTSIIVSSVQGTGQRVNSMSGIGETRSRRRRRGIRRRITPSPQENDRGSTVNLTDTGSTNHNVRRRNLVVENDNLSSETDSYNVWEVSIQETEDETVPLQNNHRVIRRRIPVVESEDDSDSISDSPNNYDLIIPDRENEVGNSLESNFNNLRRRRRRIPTVINNHNARERNIPLSHSEDESSSNESDIRPRALSNRMAPIFQSDDSSSTSSSSSTDSDDSIPIRHTRLYNSRRTPRLLDHDFDDIAGFNVNIKASTEIKAFADCEAFKGNSSDVDKELESCPICLTGFKLQEIGKPSSCNHKFCSVCIKEWATKNNTCPVDRRVFNALIVYDKIEGEVICEIPIFNATPKFEDQFEPLEIDMISVSSDESIYFEDSDGDGPDEICCVCGRSNLPHRMITCDSCDRVYHLACINPPLRNFPTSNWYCEVC